MLAAEGIDSPDPDLLAAHRAIAMILDVSGIGKKIDEYRDQNESEDGIIRRDGSTDLASMITRRLMLV